MQIINISSSEGKYEAIRFGDWFILNHKGKCLYCKIIDEWNFPQTNFYALIYIQKEINLLGFVFKYKELLFKSRLGTSLDLWVIKSNSEIEKIEDNYWCSENKAKEFIESCYRDMEESVGRKERISFLQKRLIHKNKIQ